MDIQAFVGILDDKDVSTKLGHIFRDSIKDIIEDLKNTKIKVSKLEKKIEEKDLEIQSLRKSNDSLEGRIDSLEQYSRRSSMRVYGVPEDTPGSTDEKMLAICNKHLKLQPALSLDEIEVSHRVGPQATVQEDGQVAPPRPLLVKFVSRRSKARVMKLKKQLKTLAPPAGRTNTPVKEAENQGAEEAVEEDITGENEEAVEDPEPTYPFKKPIFFQDDLTKSRATLFYLARKSKSANNLSDTWTFDGKILVKDLQNRIFEIKTESDLRNREQHLTTVR